MNNMLLVEAGFSVGRDRGRTNVIPDTVTWGLTGDDDGVDATTAPGDINATKGE